MRLPEERQHPAGGGTSGARELGSGETSSSVESVPEPIDKFLQGVLADVLVSASRAWWLRRAEEIDAAKPRPGEMHGRATRADLSARWQRLDEMARACRARAQLCVVDQSIEAEVAEVIS